MIFNVIFAVLAVQIVAAILLRAAIMFRRTPGKAEPELVLPEEPVADGRYDWAEEKAILRNKTRKQQKAILRNWIEATVESMHCSEKDAERFFAINLACVLSQREHQ